MFEAVEEDPRRQWIDDPPTVTAVIVSRNGARWLPQALEALAAQTHQPTTVTATDVGSTDASPQLLARSVTHVRTVQPGTGFGDAVRVALDGVPPTDWVWLLHDDSAPDADALACLLDMATTGEDIAVVGPKLREWPSLRRLLEVGVTLTGTGHRETGLESGEPDQGQHDRPRDVLAVSTAGMLVRRQVWDRLGGLDPALPLYCDDIDFGWRVARSGARVRVAPRAVVFHAEASDRGLREGTLAPSPARERRRAAIYTLLANAGPVGFAWQSVRLLVGSLLRVLGLLLAKAPAEAADELRGTFAAYRRPRSVLRARRERKATATRPAAEVRSLLPATSLPYRHGLDALAEVARGLVRPEPALSGRRAAVEPGREAAPEVEPSTRNVALRHPWLSCVLALLVLAAVAGRGLYGGGNLLGGALLPAPDSVGAWWDLFFGSWHDVGVGSAAPGPPYVLALAIPATLVWSYPGLVVDALLLGAVPLAALTAHRFAREVVASRPPRMWWALTYAGLVVASGAVAQGRLGTVVALVLAPALARAAILMVREPHWQYGVRVALWLALATAFAPLTYVLSAVPLLVVSAWRLRGRALWPVVLALGLPWPVLASWMWDRALDPTGWWWSAGRADAGVGALDPAVWEIALGRAGGPGAAPAWVSAGLVAAGLLALLRRDRRVGVLAAWLVALVSLAVAVYGAGTYVTPPTTSDPVPVWVGLAVTVWVASLALAAALAADGARERLAAGGPGWLRPLAAVVATAAVLAPVISGGWWLVRTTADPLQRSGPTEVPAYLVTRAQSGPATLVVHGTSDRGVDFEVYRDDGNRLGEEAVAPSAAESADLSDTVTALMANPSPDQLESLGEYGVGAIFLAPPADDDLVAVLDSVSGLSPSGSPYPDSRVWTFEGATEPRDAEDSRARPWVATVQVVTLALVVIAAVPGRRRRTR